MMMTFQQLLKALHSVKITVTENVVTSDREPPLVVTFDRELPPLVAQAVEAWRIELAEHARQRIDAQRLGGRRGEMLNRICDMSERGE